MIRPSVLERPGNTAGWRTFVLAPLVVVILAACGPELTTPSSTNISGTWTSTDTASGVTDFVLVLSQAGDGAITGTWSARGVEINGACATDLGCAPANSVVGSNTVFQVHIDLLGAGAFTGQVEDANRFRGHLAGSGLTFQRVPVIQGARLSRDVR